MKIGIVCPSEIAFRRFLPALQKNNFFEYAGVAIADKEEWKFDEKPTDEILNKLIRDEQEKAEKFKKEYGGKIYLSYKEIISDPEIDCIYLPLPPALHFEWSKLALENSKHVLIEKPSTICAHDTNVLVKLAKSKNLAIHENYMFVFHNQLEKINEIINSKIMGEIREYRISFGFPKRSASDFRYNKELGGGALLDCGGYTIKYASILLGENSEIVYADLNYLKNYNVDMFGRGILKNQNGQSAYVSFGMDNEYKCNLEIWGSKGSLISERILTAPCDFNPKAKLQIGNEVSELVLPSDDTFLKSICYFQKCIGNLEMRYQSYENIIQQANFIDDFRQLNTEKQK